MVGSENSGSQAHPGAVSFHTAESDEDKEAVMRLRTAVYVRDQQRLAHSSDMTRTFDRFDTVSEYILARYHSTAVGAVKVIPDSEFGLPCEDMADLGPLREVRGARLLEVGHLIALPRYRQRGIGLALMRQAVIRAVCMHRATTIVGDFFADDDGRLRSFYREIGFEAVAAPYRDMRFRGDPMSIVAALDLRDAAANISATRGRKHELLSFFFGDYPNYVRPNYVGGA